MFGRERADISAALPAQSKYSMTRGGSFLNGILFLLCHAAWRFTLTTCTEEGEKQGAMLHETAHTLFLLLQHRG